MIGSAFINNSIACAVRVIEEPILSSLFIKHSFGMFFLEACYQTLRVCDYTPLTPSRMVTAPSRTLRLLVTSPEKST